MEVATYYQNLAKKSIVRIDKQAIIDSLKAKGLESQIQEELNKYKAPYIPKGLEYLEGDKFKDYIHDVAIVSKFADTNRAAIISDITYFLAKEKIISESLITHCKKIHTRHNYIEPILIVEDGCAKQIGYMLRKGAVSAKLGEILTIPMNMRDGTLLCKGKGNINWNLSAPHGAGRVMSRKKAKELLNLEEYQKAMEGIYTTSANQSTVDEAPMAYKPMEEILANIKDTVKVLDTWKPIYNFKAGE